MSTLFLLNAPIAHTPDLRYVTTQIGRERAIQLAALAKSGDKLVSAIGHEGSAQVLSVLLDQQVAVNRVSMQYQPGDSAICLQLRKRQPEGIVLDAATVEAIGYDLTLIETSPAPVLVIFGSAVEAALAISLGLHDADHPVRRPGDIDVIYGGMSADEAGVLVRRWARDTGLEGHWSLNLELDLHPELCWLSPPSYSGHADLGTRIDFPSRYEVKVPHPQGTELPDVAVIAGKPKVKGLPVNSLAATIRQAAADVDGPPCKGCYIEAAKAIAKYIANQRNGLTIIMRCDRGEDASYLESSVVGLRSAWAKLMAALGDTHSERELAHDAVAGHIDGYLRGVGYLLGRLVSGISPSALQRLRYEARDSSVPLYRQHGVLEVRRKKGAENIWEAGAGELWDQATAISPWLRDLSYCDPQHTLPV